MKWVRINHEGQAAYGILNGTTIKLTNQTWADVLAGMPIEIKAQIAQDGVRFLNPIGRPGKIVCVGLNYMDHCRETNTPPPKRPLLFTKFTTSMNGPTDDIVWTTDLTDAVDFEAELGVVIGKTCRRVNEAEALAYVAGYTVANDVSARDVQLGDGQWIRGKSLDTFCPLGPAFVTVEDIPNPQKLAICSLLNGKIMQDSNTSEMIFSVAHLIAFCSQAFTLEPGDIILTGTPHGVGLGRDPQVYMQDGDVIVVEIEGIGRLENRCRIEN
ncbi:MAG: fumarylacetoacetate hydrolase family protein [Chloroflexi bacterium]|nr:fumarylacetoacetate hydrolase family protein [Chloroflexota bacterium]